MFLYILLSPSGISHRLLPIPVNKVCVPIKKIRYSVRPIPSVSGELANVILSMYIHDENYGIVSQSPRHTVRTTRVNEGRQQIEISDDRIDNRQKQYRKVKRNEKKKENKTFCHRLNACVCRLSSLSSWWKAFNKKKEKKKSSERK